MGAKRAHCGGAHDEASKSEQERTVKPAKPAAEMTTSELAAYIDHSILKPEFTPDEVRREVRAAIDYGCRTVCINTASHQ